MDRLPTLRPRLPRADHILPYLRLIDNARTYSNHGPLVRELEQRLAERFGLEAADITTASSGTTAIIGAVLATAGSAQKERPLAVIPAFSFVAAAVAVERCGYRPYLADVNAESWMLDPYALLNCPLLDRVGIVIPVAPFGRPVPQEPWLAFQKETNIRIIIDGGASFDTVLRDPSRYLGCLPVAFSFHATKSFGTGEGGAVATSNTDLAQRVVQALNFGFYGSRDSRSPSINGKMSEYHAAVGLAALDDWSATQEDYLVVANAYHEIAGKCQIANSFFCAPDISMIYALFLCNSPDQTQRVMRNLDENEIDFRFWYGRGIQENTYYSFLNHNGLENSISILPNLIGLPVAPDLAPADVERVITVVREGLSD